MNRSKRKKSFMLYFNDDMISQINHTRFSMTVTDAKANHIIKDDLSGVTEIIPNEKYRLCISNGFKTNGERNRITETFNGTLIETIQRKKDIKQEIKDKVITANSNSTFKEFTQLYLQYLEEKDVNKIYRLLRELSLGSNNE